MEETRVDITLDQPLSVQDQELFDRVWRRVMSDGNASPIILDSDQAAPRSTTTPRLNQRSMTMPQTAQRNMSTPQTMQRNASTSQTAQRNMTMPQTVQRNISTPQSPQPVAPALPIPLPVNEAPVQYDVSCLGASSLEYAPLLREMMEGVYGGWQAYQALARRAQGNTARQLRILAADQQQSLRQIGAAYFLLTGERAPRGTSTPAPTGAIDSALREMFIQEQRWWRAFTQAAQETRDSCLKILFHQMAGKAEVHMDTIRRAVESLQP